jgi:hypothetical protein
VLRTLPDDMLEELQSKLRDFFEQSNPLEPDTWDPEILRLTERLIIDGKSADNTTNEEISRALFELMSLTFIECSDDAADGLFEDATGFLQISSDITPSHRRDTTDLR